MALWRSVKKIYTGKKFPLMMKVPERKEALEEGPFIVGPE